MTAIPGATHTSRMLVDGTLAITVMVEPRHAQDAFRLLCVPGTAVAMAALKDAPTPAPDPAPQPEKAKGGERAKWVAMRCNEPEFQRWLLRSFPEHGGVSWASLQESAAQIVRDICEVQSRVELDNDPIAIERFERLIRRPWAAFNGATA